MRIYLWRTLWRLITWQDVSRLSFSFRYALVASMALVVNVGLVHVAWAGDAVVVEQQVFLDEEGDASYSTQLLLPGPGGGKWQFDFDPNDLDGSFSVGYRGRFRQFTDGTQFQPRFVWVTDNGQFDAFKLQGLVVGTVDGHPWYLFGSIKLPEEGRCSMYNEAGFDIFSSPDATLTAIVIEDHKFGQSANWKIGPELSFRLGPMTLKLHHGFGLGGTGDESRIWVTIPIN